jgi:hypothetical protein
MQYKLPERFRGGPAWFPKLDYKPLLVPQTVTRITKRIESKEVRRLDMHTETNNYFVGGVLVHNCNGRYVYGKDVHGVERLMVGSHNVWKKPIYKERPWVRKAKSFLNKFWFSFALEAPQNDDVWWTVAKRLGLAEKLAQLPNLVVYGEVYGSVQDLKYSVPADQGVRFRVFDMYDASLKQWLPYDSMRALATTLGFECVPELYRGPYIPETVDPLRTGKSTIDNVTIREGFVIRPVTPPSPQDKGAYKYVSEEYKLRKGTTTEFH